jgi:CDP-glycerol glycerophosphotransferase (TagB/SpsB family)
MLLCPSFRRKSDLLIASSKEDQKNFSTAFNHPIERIKITGYPRNDIILNSKLSLGDEESPRLGLYAPTFRGKENSNFDFFDQFGFDVEAIDRFLSSLNLKLYLKLHHFNLPDDELQKSIRSAQNICFYEGKDVYGDFGRFDFLITDFSSIYFDFLLLERPIIFASFDMAGFENSVRHLYYDYNEVTPGPKARSWAEVMQCVEDVLSGSNCYVSELKAMNDRFHRYHDAGSCERVYREVLSLIAPTR